MRLRLVVQHADGRSGHVPRSSLAVSRVLPRTASPGASIVHSSTPSCPSNCCVSKPLSGDFSALSPGLASSLPLRALAFSCTCSDGSQGRLALECEELAVS
mmetsp:Transcript_21120/g.55609  ORF Transcript_21120/g.55609 Transcript_21120/m.55609 type:complete len:101 (-) Transcript_21120:308-610(-)